MIGRTPNRLTSGPRALLIALTLGLVLAVGLYASAAKPADASVEGVCTHGTSFHNGGNHATVFKKDWLRSDGVWMHKVSHYHYVSAPNGGKWFWDWTRSFSRCHTPRA